MKKKVSIIVRCKNESKWIKILLKVLKKQSYKNYELIFCDNESTDNTLKILKKNKIKKIINIKNYKPGYAINKGISKAQGKYIVVLSAHCIPSDDNWLKKFIEFIEKNKSLVAAYGKQIPLPNTNPKNTIDLSITFRDEKIIYNKDPYFNNANSIFKATFLKKNLFDKNLSNIEDQVWAKIISSKNKLVGYTPDASVFHLHGIHQHESQSYRSNNTQKILYTHRNLLNKWRKAIFLKKNFFNFFLLINSRREKNIKSLRKKINFISKFKIFKELKIKEILIITDFKLKKKINGIKIIIIKPSKNLSMDLIKIYKKYQKIMLDNNYCIAVNSEGNLNNSKIIKLISNGVYNTVSSITFAKKFLGNFILNYPDGGYFKSISLEEKNKKSNLTLINWADGVMLDVDNLRLGSYIDKDVLFIQ